MNLKHYRPYYSDVAQYYFRQAMLYKNNQIDDSKLDGSKFFHEAALTALEQVPDHHKWVFEMTAKGHTPNTGNEFTIIKKAYRNFARIAKLI